MDLNDTITMPPSETNERISNDTSAPSNQINDIEQEDVDDSNEPNSISLLIDSNKGDTPEILQVSGTPTDQKYGHAQEDNSQMNGENRNLEVLDGQNNSIVMCNESQGKT